MSVRPGDVLETRCLPLDGGARDLDPLLAVVGDARLVLLGEATHGTREFYEERARITRLLVEEKGFTTVVVEADWPDAYRLNRFVRGTGDDADARAALGDFRRFPMWMWRNEEVVALADWLRSHNDALPAKAPRVGWYGMDLYSMHASMEAVLRYLTEADPDGAMRARRRYECFDHFGEDAQAYGYAAGLGLSPSCEEEALQQLVELRRRAGELARRDGRIPEDEHFYAEQNARLVKNAEAYYRSMFQSRTSSWNLRDAHMMDTLEALIRHFDGKGQHTKVVVWAHNSHLGDASATEMGEGGEWNVGQLARERFGDDAVLVGFTTYTGRVVAADDWDGPPLRKRVLPALPESWEALFHERGLPRFFLSLREEEVRNALSGTRLERAIGVIYRPRTERASHYFGARLAGQFDALVHIDETRALRPLDEVSWVEHEDAPDTYPHAL
jgi:erythromycin esterase-like protein